MLLGKIFERFANGSPLTVMLRGTLEYALRPEALDQLFAHTARRQYTHKLLFSTLVDLTSLVVCRVQRSHHAAYQADPARVGASLKALYDKLDHTEPAVSAALVQHTGARLIPVLQQLQAGLPPRLPGYRVRDPGWQPPGRHAAPAQAVAGAAERPSARADAGGLRPAVGDGHRCHPL